MLTKKTIGFIGGGNLAEALIKGLLSSKALRAGQILVSDRLSDRLIHIAEVYEVKVLNKNYETALTSDIIFITVKPKDVSPALKEIAPELTREKLLISVAAGITTDFMQAVLRGSGAKDFVPLIRAMPNTPATVQEGVTALFAAEGVGDKDIRLAEAVFKSVGKVVVLDDEALMDVVTGLSGSGPAYFFLIMDALVQAGVKAGLKQEDARLLVLQTCLGAAKLALQSETQGLGELRRMVTSPGGTTEAGIRKLEDAGIRDIMMSAVQAAIDRAKGLSKESL